MADVKRKANRDGTDKRKRKYRSVSYRKSCIGLTLTSFSGRNTGVGQRVNRGTWSLDKL